ncbi:hotdog fold thioesterase [Rhodococcus sp. NPDC059234]|uniref:PaaI family thioesterase n=1 Tax=Rhodococcus sp. NPDC059234 TaxID=3346781 RepID=UPI00366CF542
MTTPDTLRLDRLNALMGIRPLELEPGRLRLAQDVGPRFHDHRGRTILGSVGVLVDAVPGGAVGTAVPPGTQVVLSQVSAAMATPLPTHGPVEASGHAVEVDLDTGIGLAAGELRAAGGEVFAVLTSRGVVVSRGSTHAEEVLGGRPLPVAEPEPATDAAEFTDRSGLDVVGSIAAGTIERGPLAGLLGAELAAVEHGRVAAEFPPVDWMANPMGSVQGGVLISAADLLTGLTGQTLTGPRQGYRALDLRIDFVRSPAVGGPAVRVESEVVRAGRRLALVETRLADSTGRLLARASASVHLF